MTDGMVMTYFNGITIPIRSTYNLTFSQLQIVAGSLFVGFAIGSFLTGYISHCFLRHNTIKIFYSFLCFFYFLMGISQNILVFSLFRFLMGIFLGIILPACQNMVIEYMPVRYRALAMTSVCMGYPIGSLLFLLLELAIMPNLETAGLNMTLCLSTVILGLIYIYLFTFSRDSPRNLILHHKEEEAFKILEVYNGQKLTHSMKIRILDEVKYSVIKGEDSGLSDLFGKKFLRTTVLLSFLWVFFAMLFYGHSVVAGFTIKSIEGEKADKTQNNKNVIINLIIMNTAIIPFAIIAGYLSEIKYLGRKITMIIGLSGGLIFILLCCWVPKYFTIALASAAGFLTLSLDIIQVYSSEIYPTKIRDLALGYCYYITRMGGILSQIIYIQLNNVYTFLPYYFSAVIIVISIIMTLLLPYETRGEPLDHEYDQTAQEEEQMIKINKNI